MSSEPSDAKEAEFIRIIADGGTWREAREKLQIGNRTVSAWLQDEAFREQYARACDIRAEAIFEDILDIADNGSNDWMRDNDPENEGYRQNGEAIRRTQVRIDARKWLLGKMKPKVYGDRVTTDVNHSGSIELATKEQRDAAVAAAIRADA
jgi:hypothetical protein